MKRKAIDTLLADDTPCKGCAIRQRCAAEELACEAFRHYVETGRCIASDMMPTHALFLRIDCEESGYQPLAGSRTHRAIECLRLLPPGVELQSGALADLIDAPACVIPSTLAEPVRAGLVLLRKDGPDRKRRCFFSFNHAGSTA